MILRILFFAIFISCFSFKAFSQNAYYDAIDIAANYAFTKDKNGQIIIQSGSNPKLYSILSKYVDENKQLKPSDIDKSFGVVSGIEGNPFIDIDGSGLSGGDVAIAETAGLVSSLSGFNVTTIADGLSQFLIERANEELNILFFNRFKEVVNDDQIKAFFPTTADVLLNAEPYQYGQLIGVLKSSFRSDIRSMILNLENVAHELVRDKKIKLSDRQKTTLILGARLVKTINEVKSGASFVDLLEKFPDVYLPNSQKSNNVHSTLKTAAILSKSIRSDQSGEMYIDYNDLKSNVFASEAERKIFLGLLYEQLKGIEFYDQNSFKVSMALIIEEISKDYSTLLSYYQKLIEISENLKKGKNNLTSTLADTPDSLKYQKYYELFDLGITLIDKGFNLIEMVKLVAKPGTDEIVDRFYEDKIRLIKLVRKGNEVYKSINEKDYFSIFVHSLSAYQVLTDCGGYKKEECGGIKTSADLVKYGSFMANLAEADSPKQVKEAIKSAALPAGSSSIKKNTNVSIFLNSYLGVSRYKETLENDRTSIAYGLHAPIGPELSLGYGFLGKKYIGSFSLFVPIVDIGALTAFRVNDDNSDLDVPPLTFDNIQVFGVYGVLGIKGAPISIGVGYQKGPQLREIGTVTEMSMDMNGMPITTTEPVLSEVDWSLKLFISVDIPIFKLYAKPKR